VNFEKVTKTLAKLDFPLQGRPTKKITKGFLLTIFLSESLSFLPFYKFRELRALLC
jgi:hypothetical protein